MRIGSQRCQPDAKELRATVLGMDGNQRAADYEVFLINNLHSIASRELGLCLGVRIV
jgi:hypothetical protein